MVNKKLKQKAIHLRTKGKTYSEILRVVPVAKSTLSLWLREVGLSFPQKQRITEKRIQGQRNAAAVRRFDRIERQTKLIQMAKLDVDSISKRELWLVGIALYWAEGSKEKEYAPGIGISFSNSDARMVAVFIKWLKICGGLTNKDLMLSLYTHESHRDRVSQVCKYWSNFLSLPLSFFKKVYFKKNKINTRRKNTGNLYNGLLRVNIRSSSNLNRKITGWTQGIVENCGIV